MKYLVVIPARGGSKGIPFKNIKPLGGKPLIQYTIEAARSLFSDDQIIVSTDDLKIKEVVEQLGLKVPFIRPAELATDTASTYHVLLHAIEFYESYGNKADVILVLQPTSPFRKSSHIKEALELYNNEIDMVVSVKETKSNPYFVLFEENSNEFLEPSKVGNFTRRQDCPKVWEYNGAIYVINISSLKKSPPYEFKRIVKYVMDEYYSVDIDNHLDWLVSEILFQSTKKSSL
ncbi:MAG: acylneuraminate cytidylyltransferase family protein [Cyclobacteriaceae bacterium]|jgi:CMP-N,N'-diacetyllegionaminic acid synthase|nr:acylneuraminate cytidylyltransferase family protein [Cytophagales bacterium]MCZ8327594.1 acylneuraminate cytidylyltransferase family protein [Cyclobacteriaceae bacterium]